MASALASALLAIAVADAYEVVPAGGPNEYLKWGASKVAGTPGGVVTWGFLDAGTPGSLYCGIFCEDKSLSTLPNFYPDPRNSNTTTPLTLLSLRAVIQSAFDTWSSVANIQFQYVGVDHSWKPINDPTATSPMIRIGAYPFGGLLAFFCAGTAFGPPPNEGTGAGDVFFNTNVGYQMATDPEGSRLQDFPFSGGLYMTDVYGLALHEIGHAIGLGHSTHSGSVMCDSPNSAALTPAYKRRGLSRDDIAGAQFLYGIAPSSHDPNPTR
ncbi:MAG TPA: matrixin family metalloprotease [Burkholderiaceae bacterium]|nr:matrixin family metalloprotease [Burkholderiaceae bacterium]